MVSVGYEVVFRARRRAADIRIDANRIPGDASVSSSSQSKM
jgi:hypothetical protein